MRPRLPEYLRACGGVEKHRWSRERLICPSSSAEPAECWQHTSGCDGDTAEQLVQLLFVADGKLEKRPRNA